MVVIVGDVYVETADSAGPVQVYVDVDVDVDVGDAVDDVGYHFELASSDCLHVPSPKIFAVPVLLDEKFPGNEKKKNTF